MIDVNTSIALIAAVGGICVGISALLNSLLTLRKRIKEKEMVAESLDSLAGLLEKSLAYDEYQIEILDKMAHQFTETDVLLRGNRELMNAIIKNLRGQDK